jgi:hypothetical protein
MFTMLMTSTAKLENMTENVKFEPIGAVVGSIRCRRPELETLKKEAVNNEK